MDNVGDDFGQAALLFTDAIHAGPPSAALFAERSQAFIDDGDFAAAAADAGRAADLDLTMPRAHLRKTRACISLQRYDSARAAVEAVAALLPGDSRFARLTEELRDKSPATDDARKGGGEGSGMVETTKVKNDDDEEEKLAAGAANAATTPDSERLIPIVDRLNKSS